MVRWCHHTWWSSFSFSCTSLSKVCCFHDDLTLRKRFPQYYTGPLWGHWCIPLAKGQQSETFSLLSAWTFWINIRVDGDLRRHDTDHYSDVIMGAVASQITSVSIVCSTVCSGADQRKHQSSTSLAFVRGIHWWSVNSPHRGPVTRKMFPFDDVIMVTL